MCGYMSDTILAAIVGGICGLITGAVGSLIAPWIHWGIEKRRDKLNRRRDLINNARLFLSGNNLTREIFRQSPGLSAIRSYLPADLIKNIQSRAMGGEISLKEKILEEITKLERKWKLV